MLFYSVAGLIIASEIPLPGRDPLDRAAEAAATVRLGHVSDHIDCPAKAGPNWALNEAELLLSISGLASFLLVEGKEIRVQPAAGRRPEDASPFLTQNLLGLLMQQRGRIVLRTSTVAVEGKAVLFCGVSPAGKSTVAAAMAARGHPLLGDDFCTLDVARDGSVLVHGDGAPPMLWTDSLDALGLQDETGAAVRDGCHKYYVRRPRPVNGGLPLGAVHILVEDRRIEKSRIDILSGMRAVQAIRESTYRPLSLSTGQRLRSFETATHIARQAPILALARTHGFDWIDAGLQAIESRLRETPEERAPR